MYILFNMIQCCATIWHKIMMIEHVWVCDVCLRCCESSGVQGRKNDLGKWQRKAPKERKRKNVKNCKQWENKKKRREPTWGKGKSDDVHQSSRNLPKWWISLLLPCKSLGITYNVPRFGAILEPFFYSSFGRVQHLPENPSIKVTAYRQEHKNIRNQPGTPHATPYQRSADCNCTS